VVAIPAFSKLGETRSGFMIRTIPIKRKRLRPIERIKIIGIGEDLSAKAVVVGGIGAELNQKHRTKTEENRTY
jgi:hypothetical protein